METFDKSAGDGTTPGSVEQSGNDVLPQHACAPPRGCARFTPKDFDGLFDALFDATAILGALEARIFELESDSGLNGDDGTELRRITRCVRVHVTRVAEQMFSVSWKSSPALGTWEPSFGASPPALGKSCKGVRS